MSGPIILVDGYNLMNAFIRAGLEGDKLGDFRHEMLLQLDKYRLQTGRYRVWVVFDGRRVKGRGKSYKMVGSVRLFFSRPPDDADALIKNLCKSNRGKIYLVTSDGELRGQTSDYVISSIGSGYFLRHYLATYKDLEES